jgi:hypothetical protein
MASLGPWSPLSLPELLPHLKGLRSPWWISGGWAIDLFLGWPTRAHEDTDVGLLRRDQLAVREALREWDMHAADPPGTLRPWARGETLPLSVHDIWCRRENGAPWRFQLMLDESDGEQWVYRRDLRIRLPLSELINRTPEGVPFLKPEVQLLYKSRGRRPKDQQDFGITVPRLHDDAKRWLADALRISDPGNPWLEALPQ